MKLLSVVTRKGAGPAAAVVISILFGAGLIALTGGDPVLVYGQMLRETIGTPYGIGQIMFKATTLIFTGLSAAVCFRSGLFSIGAEGQLIAGAFAMAISGIFFPGLSPLFAIPLCLLAGMTGGAAWAFIPGMLKARFGSHEVINTIMMNYIAAALVSYFVNSVFAVSATVHTPLITPAANLPRFDTWLGFLQGSPFNMSFVIAIGACLAVSLFFSRTRRGYELRAVGLNPVAAGVSRINVPGSYVLAMVISGGLAGLGGSNFVLGYKHYYEIGFSEGAGFMGIAVALLGGNKPSGIVAAALFFAFLDYGGLVVNVLVPKEIVIVLQAVIIILVVVLSGDFLKRFLTPATDQLAGASVD